MHGLCTHKNGVTTATKYCPACGRLGLEFHETENFSVQGGNLVDGSGFYFSCPTCGYCGDGELVPPELPFDDDDSRDFNDVEVGF